MSCRAIDHDVGNVVAGKQWLQRSVSQNVVANVFEQFFLLGNRHCEILETDDVIDDIANFLARGIDIETGQL